MPDPTYNVMSWDEASNRLFEYGVSKGVLYKMDTNSAYTIAAPWNGLTNVTDKPTGADATDLWADGILYGTVRAAEKYEATIEAYTYPDEFEECNGFVEPTPGLHFGQQNRKKFAMCWRTEVGNAENDNLGYKLHLAYGLTASPSESAHKTAGESIETDPFSWDVVGTPLPIAGYKPLAKIVIDSTKVDATKLAALEAILYGSDSGNARLPLPAEVLSTLMPANNV